MNALRIEHVLWSAALLCGTAAVAGTRTLSPVERAEHHSIHVHVGSTASTMRDIDDAAISLVDADPFRTSRHPSPIAYHTDVEGAPPSPPRPPRPGLSVSGIIGGPPWSAVLEGLPGHEGGTVVHPGDTLGGLRIRSVRRDTVVISGVDTTWRLIVRRAW